MQTDDAAAGCGAPSVMIVEDDVDELTSLAKLFGDAGYHVVTTPDGQEAFEHLLVHDTLPSAIVVALELPLVNGWELLTLVRSYHRFASIAVVVVSPKEMPTPTPPASDEKRTAYVRKPVEPEALLALVRSLALHPEA